MTETKIKSIRELRRKVNKLSTQLNKTNFKLNKITKSINVKSKGNQLRSFNYNNYKYSYNSKYNKMFNAYKRAVHSPNPYIFLVSFVLIGIVPVIALNVLDMPSYIYIFGSG